MIPRPAAVPLTVLAARRWESPESWPGEWVLAFGGTEHYACRRAGPGAIAPYVHGQLEGCYRCWF